MNIFIIYLIISSIIGCLLAMMLIKLIKIVISLSIKILKRRKSKKDNKYFDNLLQNCSFKIKLPRSNYTQEQIYIVELQEKVEKLEKRIEEIENKKESK